MMNKLLRISITFLTISLLVLNMCPISAFAVSVVYEMPFSKPTVTPYSGYIECLWQSTSSSSDSFVTVHTWNYTPTNNDDDVSDNNFPSITLTRNSSSLKLTVSRYYDNSGRYSFSDMTFQDFVYYSTTVNDANSTRQSTFSFTGYKLAGVHVYGSYDDFVNMNDYVNLDFAVSYGSDSFSIYLIQELLLSVQSLADVLDDPNYTSQLNSIISALNKIDYSEELYSIEQSLGDINDFNSSLGEMLTLNLSRLTTLGNNILNEIKKSSTDFSEIKGLVSSLESRLASMLDILESTNSWLEDIYLFLETWIIDLNNWIYELYFIEADSNQQLVEIKGILNSILELLEAGQELPSLQTPDDSIDSVYGDVTGWFSDIDGFGDQLASNRAENQQNLAIAGNVINGFFDVCPPSIIVAVALCAIMIVVVKVIGR